MAVEAFINRPLAAFFQMHESYRDDTRASIPDVSSKEQS
jgi:hypothetical protein